MAIAPQIPMPADAAPHGMKILLLLGSLQALLTTSRAARSAVGNRPGRVGRTPSPKNALPQHPVRVSGEKVHGLCLSKWGDRIGVAWKDVLAGSEGFVAGLVEAHEVAVGVGKMIADESRREVPVDTGDLVQPI